MTTILVVDDDDSARGLIATALRSLGDVVEARSPEQALQLVRERRGTISLVVTDIAMPGMTGVEFALRLRPQRDPRSMLFVSGVDGPELIPAHFPVPWQFLQKPFRIAELRERARSLIEGTAQG